MKINLPSGLTMNFEYELDGVLKNDCIFLQIFSQ